VRRLGTDRTLRGQAEAFAAGFDVALLTPRVWVPVRVATAVGLLALAFAASSIEPLREFFQLRPAVPVALLVASVALVFGLGVLNQRGVRDPLVFFGGLLIYCFLETTMTASFAVFAAPPGAFLLAILPVLRAALNGLGLGARPGVAALTAAHGIGVLAALALRPDVPHAWLILLAAPGSMASFLYLARESGRVAEGRARVAAQGAALQAQLVVERASTLEVSRATLGDLLQRRHDARSALSTARLAADRLKPLVRQDPVRRELVDELLAALDALQIVVAPRRTPRVDARAESGPQLERVEVEPVLRAVLEGAQARAPSLRTRVSATPQRVAVRVRGGAATLYQILEELALNAAEGDGRRGALDVEVSVAGDPAAGSAAIRIADDGPGLPESLLGRTVEPFTTTKAYGVGLGLYTAERLARASGGSLRLENPPGGGAAVTVYLELAPDGASLLAADGSPPPLHGPTEETA
jgi:signal transduction histidine kinase